MLARCVRRLQGNYLQRCVRSMGRCACFLCRNGCNWPELAATSASVNATLCFRLATCRHTSHLGIRRRHGGQPPRVLSAAARAGAPRGPPLGEGSVRGVCRRGIVFCSMAWRAAPPDEPNLQRGAELTGGTTTHNRESEQSERLFCCVLLSEPVPGPLPETISSPQHHHQDSHGEDTQWTYEYTLPLCLHMVLCPVYAQKRSSGCEPAGDFPISYHIGVNVLCCCVQIVPSKEDEDDPPLDSSCRPWICCWKWSCCDSRAARCASAILTSPP